LNPVVRAGSRIDGEREMPLRGPKKVDLEDGRFMIDADALLTRAWFMIEKG
jgi:hypothetical protein